MSGYRALGDIGHAPGSGRLDETLRRRRQEFGNPGDTVLRPRSRKHAGVLHGPQCECEQPPAGHGRARRGLGVVDGARLARALVERGEKGADRRVAVDERDEPRMDRVEAERDEIL